MRYFSVCVITVLFLCLSTASGASNDAEIARLFLQSSDAIKDYINQMDSINIRHEPCKMTILDHAVVNGNYEIAEYLLQRGAEPNSRWASRDTSLHAATEAGDVAMARLLLLFGADPAAKNNVQFTPFVRAVSCFRYRDDAEFARKIAAIKLLLPLTTFGSEDLKRMEGFFKRMHSGSKTQADVDKEWQKLATAIGFVDDIE